MHNTKGITARSGFTVLLIILVMAVLLFTRGNSIRNVGYNVVHYVTGQEVKLMTAHWEQIETRHYNIRFQPQDGRYADMVGEAAESAYTDVTPIFNRLPQKKTTIIIYPDSASLAQSFGWDKNEKALGVYWGGSIRILSPGQWLPDHDKETFWKEGPMVHEFAHLLVDDITKGNYNRWWTEGIAQYVEKQTTGFEFDDPFANSQDMNYYHFSTLAQDFDNLDQATAYWQSLKAVEFIAQKYGDQSLFKIMECLGEQQTMDQALRQTLGIDMNTFEQEFVQFIRQNY